ncbi:MAG: threonine synthase [Chloroflexi bacterium]|nr:threonine synthase [Chloroflexota bacterium]
MSAYHFECTVCGARYEAADTKYVCPRHGDAGILDTRLISRAGIAKPGADSPRSIWRYLALLPIEPANIEPLLAKPTPFTSVGWTPLYRASRLGSRLGLSNLYIKDDGRNPSASFKDRASAFVVAKAIEHGEKIITTASSGNAGAALACISAAVGLPAVIFVPAAAPQAKVAQLLMFGATVLLVKGTYDDAFDLCLAASKEFGWYCRNTAYNPFTVEGKKTVSFEIAEQLGWRAPHRVFVGVGDGNIISGVWKGFQDLLTLGWIDRMPRLYGVQAAGSAACYNAWREGQATGRPAPLKPVEARTIADSISVGLPRDGLRAVRAVRETGGAFITVGDDDILKAMKTLAQQAAVFAEPAGSVGFAGLQKMAHQVGRDETVVVIVTGSGLKDVPAAMQAAGSARVIEPKLSAVEAIAGQFEN